jgi:hypothetical protein
LGQNPKSQLIIPFTARGAAYSISRKVAEFLNTKKIIRTISFAALRMTMGLW